MQLIHVFSALINVVWIGIMSLIIFAIVVTDMYESNLRTILQQYSRKGECMFTGFPNVKENMGCWPYHSFMIPANTCKCKPASKWSSPLEINTYIMRCFKCYMTENCTFCETWISPHFLASGRFVQPQQHQWLFFGSQIILVSRQSRDRGTVLLSLYIFEYFSLTMYATA